MDQNVESALKELDSRLKKVEVKVFAQNSEPKPKVSAGNKNYTGLKGGIQLLINENFFSIQKSRDEIHKELARQGYHPAKSAMQTALNRDFMKKKRILTRIRDGNVWKYVIKNNL